MYELRDIPSGSPDAKSSSGTAYTHGIYQGDRCVFRFRGEALKPTLTSPSYVDQMLERLNHPTAV